MGLWLASCHDYSVPFLGPEKKEASMCKRLVLILCLALLAQLFLVRCGAASEDLLTIDDVEKVTGVHGLKLVPKSSQMGAGGDLNFALEDGTLVLMATIQDSSTYKQWKAEEGFFYASVSGIGDEAFEGPSFGEFRYILVFRIRDKGVCLTSFVNMAAGGNPFLSQEQLRELAKVLVSRL
jgi:hypothetical protein